MTRAELHSVENHDATTTDPTPARSMSERSEPGRGWHRTVSRGVGAAWWWAILPTLRSGLASPGWARLSTAAASALCRWRVQLIALGVLLTGLTVAVLAGTATPQNPAVLPTLGFLATVGEILAGAAAVVVAVPIVRAVYPHTIRGRVRIRYGFDGWASWWDLHRYVSAHAVRAAAVASRPSIAAAASAPGGRPDPGRIERLPAGRCGTWLGRTVVGPVVGTDCYAAHRDVIGLIAPPQTGKTALLGHHVIDHDGPVMATSTKVDIYDYCAGARAEQGPVMLFNPENLGGLGSTVWWSPVRGCADSQTAAERAGHMVGAAASGDDDGDRWDDWAAAVLCALLMAADLNDRDMATVARWVFNPTSDARTGGAAEALALLTSAPAGRVPAGAADALRQVLATDARKTRDSIFLTLQRSVKFMTDPTIAALVTASPDPARSGAVGSGSAEFDAQAFVAGRGALFVIGSDRAHAAVAPLLAAFTGHVFETAKRVAATRAKGRLDPPLGMFLDEVALITPVPLDRWLADAGGRGVHIEWAAQSPSQLAQRWGARGADTIWNATNVKLVYGGLSLDEDLEAVSRLCGHRHEPVTEPDGRERFERVRVCPPDRLRVLPQWHAVLIHRATPATIVRVRPVWTRRDLRPAPPRSVIEPSTTTPRRTDDTAPAAA
ncbi:type IV secretory pathway TraG/TraD family ATPase VirD4 [Pseudonocardia sediminis]|uniref:Type IV secretory pathway TraG/TraD family ATPase VirD4 n=1 Tax=Pseudonocardia sediminis TaxID=1397368 RepID=A0A4Q7UBJ3_PSEST|nr:type IV secretory system conjugative DNA transfer family protein [Pseudonocardia sediminis]RZT75451.1 type IV secretory pathway TraG/TraD family ATPase VirD4 [Pseudonocardia sediminis]